ncbi:unnamed protein product [Acanthocheilonema viteae]|uniref:Uncharacterized protein n=1 Tax=Acanthocheilonema viteae TaxID=6277 RepID=A0A498S4B2_ACAVI|nr:unnamed protein product [Acanthocheilonema viteae]
MKYIRYVGFVELLVVVEKAVCSINIASGKGKTLDEGKLDECDIVKEIDTRDSKLKCNVFNLPYIATENLR